ncbi:MAG: hypothetical protein EZS28_028105, partial [Streblomastix strix]
MNETQGSDIQTSSQTGLLARKGIKYANNMMAMTGEQEKQLFDAEIQVLLAASPFLTSTFTIREKDYESKMKYLCRRVLDENMKAVKRENLKDLFINMRKGATKLKIQSRCNHKRMRQRDTDEGGNEPFKGFPERLNELRKQQGTRSGRTNNSQQQQRTHDRTRLNPEKQMVQIPSRKMTVHASALM